jgi:hypothetical protein
MCLGASLKTEDIGQIQLRKFYCFLTNPKEKTLI